jgi:cupin fold WbuC family metalloprotein
MPEVIFNTADIVKIDDSLISSLKAQAESNLRKRTRFCLHKDLTDKLHQMVIALSQKGYVRPHKHPNKIESFHIIEGALMLFIFDDQGKIIERFKMGEKGGGDCFVCRIEKGYWHTLVPITDFVVVHEITNGPFTNTNNSVFPNWAPEEGDVDRVNWFLSKLKQG